MTKRKPPGLGVAGGALWRGVTRDYDLSVPELSVLERACRTMDLLTACDAELASGVLGEGSMGQMVRHPLLAASADLNRVLLLQLQALALPLPGESFGHVRSPQAQAAAQARWRSQGVGV